MEQELYKLPEGWEWKDLVSVTEMSRRSIQPQKGGEYNYIGLEHIEGGTGRLLDYSATQGDSISSSKTEFSKGMVLYGKLRPYLNKVHVAQFDGIATTEIIPFKCLDEIYSDYLAAYMRSGHFLDAVMSNCSGARMPRVTTKFFKSIAKIPLPPINEQKRIVAKLDAFLTRIDTIVTYLQETLKLSKALFASAMKTEVSGYGHDWPRLSLNNLGVFSGGGTPSKSKPEYWDGEIPWISPKDMKSWELSDSELKITSLAVSKSSAKMLPKNSVLIVARSGILRHTLPVCINRVEATVNQDIKVFIPGDDVIPEYMQYLLKGHEEFILSQLVKGGVTVESLKYKEFQEQSFPIPDIKTQRKIIDHLDAISERTCALEEASEEKLNYLTVLKASLLDSAFRGQL